MKFYHGCSEEQWELTKKQGHLLYPRGDMSPCVYLARDVSVAETYGDVVLAVEYNPDRNPRMNNYQEECWQVRVYEPIQLKNIKKLKDGES